jgi:hypothetical protein
LLIRIVIQRPLVVAQTARGTTQARESDTNLAEDRARRRERVLIGRKKTMV